MLAHQMADAGENTFSNIDKISTATDGFGVMVNGQSWD
jgi:hypothetical protein